MPEQPPPASRRRRITPMYVELSGYCRRCHDLFTVLFEETGRARRIMASQTYALVDGRLLHRPGHCGGEIQLLRG